MSVEFIGVEWDGLGLPVHAFTSVGQVLTRIPRDTIHAIPFYSDAIERDPLGAAFDLTKARSSSARKRLRLPKLRTAEL